MIGPFPSQEAAELRASRWDDSDWWPIELAQHATSSDAERFVELGEDHGLVIDVGDIEAAALVANRRWSSNAIQFPRLLAEIAATQTLDDKALCESMDLTENEVAALFDRAQAAWGTIKSEH